MWFLGIHFFPLSQKHSRLSFLTFHFIFQDGFTCSRIAEFEFVVLDSFPRWVLYEQHLSACRVGSDSCSCVSMRSNAKDPGPNTGWRNAWCLPTLGHSTVEVWSTRGGQGSALRHTAAGPAHVGARNEEGAVFGNPNETRSSSRNNGARAAVQHRGNCRGTDRVFDSYSYSYFFLP